MTDLTELEYYKIQSIAMDIQDELGTDKLGHCVLAILDYLAPFVTSSDGTIPMEKAIAYGNHLMTIQNGIDQRLLNRDWYSE